MGNHSSTNKLKIINDPVYGFIKIPFDTVFDLMEQNGIPLAPARKRTTTWAEFIRAHLSVLAGTDFFTVEVLTFRGLVT